MTPVRPRDRGDNPPTIRFERLGPSGDVVLRHLFQLYIHDMSEWLALDTQTDGTYLYDTTPFWQGDFAVTVATVDGSLAGFGVVGGAPPAGQASPRDVRDVKEFFVLRRYRHQGVGDALALHLWAECPGAWLVRVLVTNQPAVSFWRRMVRGHRGDAYEERSVMERGHDSVERSWIHLSFDSGPTSSAPP